MSPRVASISALIENRNHQLVIKLPIGDKKFVMGVFSIGDWGFRIEDFGKINMGKTPILNSKSPIGYFITHWRFPLLVL